MYLSLNVVYLILRNSVCTMIKMYSKNSLLKFHPSTKLYLIFGSIHSMNWKTTIHLQCQKRLWPHCHTIDATSKWVEINSDRTFLFYCKFSFDLKWDEMNQPHGNKKILLYGNMTIYLINIFTGSWPWYGKTIHTKWNCISINLIIILCFLTGAWLFLTSKGI